MNTYRDNTKNAKEQLQIGEKIFREVIFPLADLSHTWTHRGLICLPNIDSREFLIQYGFTKQDIKVNISTRYICMELEFT